MLISLTWKLKYRNKANVYAQVDDVVIKSLIIGQFNQIWKLTSHSLIETSERKFVMSCCL